MTRRAARYARILARWYSERYDGPETRRPEWVLEAESRLEDELSTPNTHPVARLERVHYAIQGAA